tara:strand:- start:23 stop:235 length:213 start_codon:yes stop_codon:yes gene_type:complete
MPPAFLSCLRGSELYFVGEFDMDSFLSCLRGSELQRTPQGFRFDFLSCLRGSELGGLAGRLQGILNRPGF